MPEEILLIIVTSIMAGTLMALFGMTLNYRKSKFEYRTSEPSGLAKSELEDMIRSAVTEATLPLAEKIDALQDRLDAPRLEADLGEMIDELPEEERMPVRGRTR